MLISQGIMNTSWNEIHVTEDISRDGVTVAISRNGITVDNHGVGRLYRRVHTAPKSNRIRTGLKPVGSNAHSMRSHCISRTTERLPSAYDCPVTVMHALFS